MKTIEKQKTVLIKFIVHFSLVVSVLIIAGCNDRVTSGDTPHPAALVSGVPIPVGNENSTGPMAGTSIWHTPFGYAHVFDSEQPDLFIKNNDRWYPGVFVVPWLRTADCGTPVFGERIAVESPLGVNPGTVFQTEDGVIHGIFLDGMDLVHTHFETADMRFVETGRIRLEGLRRSPHALAVINNPDGSMEVILGMHDGQGGRIPGWRDKSWRPYDDKGKFTGSFNNCFLYAVHLSGFFSGPASMPRLVSESRKEALGDYRTLTTVNLGEGRERDVVGGSRNGNLRYYQNRDQSGSDFSSGYVVGTDGNLMRHPVIGACPADYPNPETGLSDLIAAGEGGFYYYKFTGEFNYRGDPVYENPVPVLQEGMHLYGGSLPVPNVVDWNGNGVMDLIIGYSDGRILFHENKGTNEFPAFMPGVPLKACGREIHVQPGYSMSLQGPGESRWGYVSPAVADWNGDGLPDLLVNDATSQHRVFMNRGSVKSPELDCGQSFFVQGLELFGAWRSKPAVARMGERMAYIILDGDDELHLYWRIDDYNLEDGGKLTLTDGSHIRANFLDAGGSGRAKLNLADWTGNGKMDLVIGTPRHGSFPNPETGLPQSLGLPGSSVLLMENAGTNEEPVFEFPRLMLFKGEPKFFGQHEIGVAVADFGNPGGYDLIVSRENGMHYFFRHEDISFVNVP